MKHPLLEPLLKAGYAVREKVQAQLRSQAVEVLSSVVQEVAADTIFHLDKQVEDVITAALEKDASRLGGIVLVAEGIGNEQEGIVLGKGHTAASAAWRVIMDPIDGTREIMYDKRSAWCLGAAAPNFGPKTRSTQLEVAVMVELPTTRSWLSDVCTAVRGQGTFIKTQNLLDGTERWVKPSPSQAETLLGGFGQVARFLPPGRDVLAKLEDTMIGMLYPDAPEGRVLCFEDQYISTGGQFYQVLMGKDRYIADIREALNGWLRHHGRKTAFVCHPYDVCAELVATEAGVILTDSFGKPLDLPLDLESPVDWIAYCNPRLQKHLEPVLLPLIEDMRSGIM